MKKSTTKNQNKKKPINPYTVLKEKFEISERENNAMKFIIACLERERFALKNIIFKNVLDVPVWVRVVRVFNKSFRTRF